MRSRPLPVLLLLTFGVTPVLVLTGCAEPPPAPPKPVQVQYDRCGNNVRNPMGLPADIAARVAMTDPTSYARMITDYYEKNPQCRL